MMGDVLITIWLAIIVASSATVGFAAGRLFEARRRAHDAEG